MCTCDRHDIATLRNATIVTANCFNQKRSKTNLKRKKNLNFGKSFFLIYFFWNLKFATFKDTEKFTCRENGETNLDLCPGIHDRRWNFGVNSERLNTKKVSLHRYFTWYRILCHGVRNSYGNATLRMGWMDTICTNRFICALFVLHIRH